MAYLASETFGTMAQYAFVTMLPSVDACEVDGESTRLYTLEMDDQGEISVTKDTFEHEFFQFDMPTNPAALVGDVRNERRRRNRRSNGNTQSQMAQVPVQLAAATRTRQPGSLIPRVMVAPPVAKANSQHAAQQHLERYTRAIVDPEHANAKVPNGGTGRSAAFKNSARVGLVTGSNGYGFCSLLPTAANDVPCIGATTATSTDTSFPNAVNGFTAATSSMFSQAPFAAAQFGINTLSPPTYEQAQSRPVSGIIKVTNETPYNNRGGEAYFINGYDSSINGLSYSDIERLRAEGMVTDIPTDGSTGEFHYRPTSNRDWDFGSTLPNSYIQINAATGLPSSSAAPHMGIVVLAPSGQAQTYRVEYIMNEEYKAPASISSIFNSVCTPLALYHPDVTNVHAVHEALLTQISPSARPAAMGGMFDGIGKALGWVGRQVGTVAKGAYNIVKPIASKKGLEFVAQTLEKFATEIPAALAVL
jgi:hypothetical protein